MAYTFGKTKHKDTHTYWDLWNKKNKNVENHFLAKWKRQFDAIREECKKLKTKENLVKGQYGEEPYYSEYIGTWMQMTPSGKIYTPFANSNVSVKEAAIDEFWNEKFEEMLDEEGCWHQTGEGCYTDVFLCTGFDEDKYEVDANDMTDEDFDRILVKKILPDLTPADYLGIPGITEILIEYYNNDIIEEYKQEVIAKIKGEDQNAENN